LLAAHLAAANAQPLPPIADASNHLPIQIRAGNSQELWFHQLGRDPDGDDNSYTIEIIDAGPLTVTKQEPTRKYGSEYGTVTISAPAQLQGDFVVRYRLRDIQGLVSNEYELPVHVYGPAFERFHNSAIPEDADRDGKVTPLDALKLVMLLNQKSYDPATGMLNFYSDDTLAWDVSQDKDLTPLDVLTVIMHLTR
jgi:hypothetical protein